MSVSLNPLRSCSLRAIILSPSMCISSSTSPCVSPLSLSPLSLLMLSFYLIRICRRVLILASGLGLGAAFFFQFYVVALMRSYYQGMLLSPPVGCVPILHNQLRNSSQCISPRNGAWSLALSDLIIQPLSVCIPSRWLCALCSGALCCPP